MKQRLLSVAEVAVAAGVTEKVVRHALNRNVIARAPNSTAVLLAPAAAYALALFRGSPVELSQQNQRALFDVLVSGRSSALWTFSLREGRASIISAPTRVDFRAPELIRNVETRLAQLARLEQRIVSDPSILSGAPVFKGTRALVRRVAAMAGKLTAVELRVEYPQLRAEDFELAQLFVRLVPRAKRRRIGPRLMLREAPPARRPSATEHRRAS